MKFVLKNPCQQQCILSVALCQRSYACPIAQHLQTTWKVLGAHFFGTMALIEFVLKTRANSSASQYVASSQQSSPKLFPTVSLPSTLSSFQYGPFPPQSSLQAISHGFPSVHPVVTPVSLLPTGTLPPRPPSHHSRIAPSHRGSPQAISHGFPPIHPVVIPVSPLPTGALPKLFPTVSPPWAPSTLSSLPYRSLATKCLNENPSIGDAFGKNMPNLVRICWDLHISSTSGWL